MMLHPKPSAKTSLPLPGLPVTIACWWCCNPFTGPILWILIVHTMVSREEIEFNHFSRIGVVPTDVTIIDWDGWIYWSIHCWLWIWKQIELTEGRAGDKLSYKKKPKITSGIPILNGFHVELNFLEGVPSSVSYDDKIGVPFNRISSQYTYRGTGHR